MFQVDLELIKKARLEKGYSLQDMADKMNFKNTEHSNCKNF